MPEAAQPAESNAAARTPRQIKLTGFHPAAIEKSSRIGRGTFLGTISSQATINLLYNDCCNQRRRQEREKLWIELGYEEKEQAQDRKMKEEVEAQHERRRQMQKAAEEQLRQLDKRRAELKEQQQMEREMVSLWYCS